MEPWALATSIVSLIVATIGTVLANMRATASEKLSREALEDARGARTNSTWSEAISAVQRFIGLDPTVESVREELLALRTTLAELVDALDGWPELGPWLEVERALGTGFGRQVMESHNPNETLEEHVTLLAPLHDWAQKLVSNLRLARRVGYQQAEADLAKLRVAHRERLYALYDTHGWERPKEFESL